MNVSKPFARRRGEHLQHRLIDHLGVEALGPRVLRGRGPILATCSNSSVVIPLCEAASTAIRTSRRRRGMPLCPRTKLNGSWVFHSRCCGASVSARIRRRTGTGSRAATPPRACRRCRTPRCARPRNKSGPSSFAAAATKARRLVFAAPSFYKRSGVRASAPRTTSRARATSEGAAAPALDLHEVLREPPIPRCHSGASMRNEASPTTGSRARQRGQGEV